MLCRALRTFFLPQLASSVSNNLIGFSAAFRRFAARQQNSVWINLPPSLAALGQSDRPEWFAGHAPLIKKGFTCNFKDMI